MKFSVHGPFDVPSSEGIIDTSPAAKKDFWNSVDDAKQGLSSACGCYIFVLKAKRGSLPWYVGRTTKRTSKGETLGAHQIGHYDIAMDKKVGVKAQLFFLAKETTAGKFAKPSKNSHRDIEFLEIFLFGIALNRNAALSNAKDTKSLRSICVPGVINSPQRRPYRQESKLKSALGL